MSKNTKRRISPYIALIFIIVAIYFISTMVGSKVNDITFSTLKKNLDKQNVEKLNYHQIQKVQYMKLEVS